MHTRLLSGVALVALLIGSASSLAEDPKIDIDKEAEKKLLLAFGKDHKGVRDAKIKFAVKASEWVFACDTFEIEADGWVKITPGYMAMMDKNRLCSRFEAPHLRLKMDRKVKGVGDMNQALIKHLEFKDGVRVEGVGKP